MRKSFILSVAEPFARRRPRRSRSISNPLPLPRNRCLRPL